MVDSALARPALLPARADLCLDYANTRYWRGTEPVTEELHTLEDVLAWHAAREVLPADAIAAMASWWQARPRLAEAAFGEAIALREALYRTFSAAAAGTAPDGTDVDALNGVLAHTPARVRLCPAAAGYAWQVARLRPATSDLLAPVLWSAADLLTHPRLARLRRCANDKCLYLFVDDSRNGMRRWCSMSTCGNRAKAHRHYAKHRPASTGDDIC
jgi:predicted RNA-binding Zn ribbon-like protein